MTDKVKLGLIGTGMMGRNHIETLQKHYSAQATVAAVCDSNPGELERAQKMAPAAKALAQWKDLLNEKMDGIIISTPNYTHAEIAIAAIHQGLHVLSEKPVATMRPDCLRMVKAAEKSDKTLMIGHELRYSQYFTRIKEIIASGEIGTPRLLWCKEFRTRFLPKIDNWIQDRARSGGALVDKNCHHFDLMNWWLGLTPTAVSAFGGTDVVHVLGTDNEIEDNATVIVDYGGQARATLLLSMIAPIAFPEPLEFGIFGNKGFLGTTVSKNEITVILCETPEHIEEKGRSFHYRKQGNDTVTYSIPPVKSDYGGHNGFTEEHGVFIEAIRTGKRTLTDVRSCLYGTLIPVAAEESMLNRKTVVL